MKWSKEKAIVENLTLEKASSMITPYYNNMTKFWTRYYHSAASVLHPSFASKMMASNRKHWTFVKRKVGEGSSSLGKWLDGEQGGKNT